MITARWGLAGFAAGTALFAKRAGFVESATPLLIICAVVGGYNLVIGYSAVQRAWPHAVAAGSLFLDVLALTALLHYSGDMENPLMFAYSLPVAAGTLLGSRRLGFALAGTSALLFFLLVCATLQDAFPVHLAHHHLALDPDVILHIGIDPDLGNQGWGYILTHTMALAAILFGTAYGLGTLTERIREREAEVARQHERMGLLLSILPESVALLSHDGRIILANPAAERLLGAEAGREVGELDPRLGVAERFAAFSGPVEEFESNYHDRKLNQLLAMSNPAGPIVWIVRDLTERHRLLAQLIHQSKMADMGLLAAGIAHEIGNPLSALSAMLQMLERKNPGPEMAERLKPMHGQIARMGRIVRDVGSFARPSNDRRTRLAAGELVEKGLQIFRLHEKGRGMQMRHLPGDDSAMVEGVEDHLVQALLNLLLNAADASGGTGRIEVGTMRAGGEVQLRVSDEGAGMTAATQEHLFTPFFTTKEPGKGTGLGLFIGEAIIRAHGGRIEVASKPDEGSTFTIVLPAA